MKADDISVRTIAALEKEQVVSEYFDRNDVYVAGTIFPRNKHGSPLLIQQSYVPKEGDPYYNFKIPGGVADLKSAHDQHYFIELRSVLRVTGYVYNEREAIVLHEKRLHKDRTVSERAFILKFIEETGLVPVTFKYRHHQTRSSTKGTSKDFLQIFFLVREVYDASVHGKSNEYLLKSDVVNERKFTSAFKIEKPRVMDLSFAQAVCEVIDTHQRPLEVLHSFL